MSGFSSPLHNAMPRLARVFARDAAKSVAALEAIILKGGVGGEEDIRAFIVHVHGMKSALANIGNLDLSALALRLERLGREGQYAKMIEEAPAFVDALKALVSSITSDENPSEARAGDLKVSESEAVLLREKLPIVRTACENLDEELADKLLTEMAGEQWSLSNRLLLDSISALLLHSDFEEIVQLVDAYMAS